MIRHLSKAHRYVVADGLGPFLVRAVAGGGLLQIGGMLMTFIAGVQLARGLGVHDLGYYGTAMAVIALASIPGQFGLPKLVLREVAAARSRGDDSELFGVIGWADRMSLLISAVALAAFVAGTFLFLHGPGSALGTTLLWGAAMVPLTGMLTIRGAAVQGLGFVVLGLAPNILIRPAVFSILLVLLFHFAPAAGADAAIALNSAAALLAWIIADHWLRTRLPSRPEHHVVQHRRWLLSSIPMAATDGMRMVQPQLIILILALAANPTEVGLLRIGVSILAAMSAASIVINTVVLPLLAKLHAENDQRRLRMLVTRAAQAQFVATLLMCAPLLLAGKPLLILIFGAEYGPAALPTAILLIGLIVNTAFGPNAALLNMSGQERRLARDMLVGLFVSVAAALILGRIYGAVGAALAISASQLAWNSLASIDAKRFLNINTTFVSLRNG